MGVTGHQGPGIDFGFSIRSKISEAGYEILSIIFIIEYFSLFYPPDDNPTERGTKHRGHPDELGGAYLLLISFRI